MSQSNNNGIIERVVNIVMGVKTDDNNQSPTKQIIAFVVHLALGDTWNTIFTVERRLGAAVPVVILGPFEKSWI